MTGELLLLVDDEPNIIKLAQLYLEREGYQTITAADGKAALEAVELHHPALIILDQSVLDLTKLLTHVAEQLIPQASRAQVHLKLDLESMPTCIGDNDRLAQVFTNLVDNAIKHTPPEGIVRVNAWSESGLARIQIMDSDDGIQEEHLPRIFERFYKIDKSRKKDGEPGTGLGLVIAQQIINAHDGWLSVERTVGVGSIFEVVLPVVRHDDSTVSVKHEELNPS